MLQSQANGGFGSITKTFAYDALGNLTSKSDVGTYSYAAGGCNAVARPHAVTTVSGAVATQFCYDANGNMTSGNGISVTWTAFDMPLVFDPGRTLPTIGFDYGPEHQRIRQNSSAQTILYAGSMELVTVGANATLRTYLPRGIGVVLDTGVAPRSVMYFHRDHLGSLTGISNSSGALIESFAYDAFGRRRNVNGSDLATWTSVNDRYGYTGHEMLDSLKLVHMNGRVFDPLIGRFLAADPYVTEPNRPQGLNRYSYVQNNPLKYTDPSGYETEVDIYPSRINVRPEPEPSEFIRGLRASPISNSIGTAGTMAPAIPFQRATPSGSILSRALGWLGRGFSAGPGLAVTLLTFSTSLNDVPSFSPVIQNANGTDGDKATPLDAPAGEKEPVGVYLPTDKYPEAAQHIQDAKDAGHPDVLTWDPERSKENRSEAMKGHPAVKGKDRDEYPPASTREGGKGASVRPIEPSDNRGAGACIGAQCRGLPPGTPVRIIPL